MSSYPFPRRADTPQDKLLLKKLTDGLSRSEKKQFEKYQSHIFELYLTCDTYLKKNKISRHSVDTDYGNWNISLDPHMIFVVDAQYCAANTYCRMCLPFSYMSLEKWGIDPKKNCIVKQ